MSVTTAVPSRLNASEGRRIAPTKSAFEARYSRMACVLFVFCGVVRYVAFGCQVRCVLTFRLPERHITR